MPVRFWSNSSSRCELPIICGKGYFGIQTRAKNHFKPSKPLPYPSTLPKEQQKLQFDVNVTKWLRWFQSNDPIFKQLLLRQKQIKSPDINSFAQIMETWSVYLNPIVLKDLQKQKRSEQKASVPTWQFVAVMDDVNEEEDDANVGRSAAHSWRPTFSNRENLGHLLLLTFCLKERWSFLENLWISRNDDQRLRSRVWMEDDDM